MKFDPDWNKMIGNIIATVKWKHNAQFAIFGAIGALVNTSNLFALLCAALLAYVAAGFVDLLTPLFRKRQ
jgi:hypothetical protein